MNQPKYNLGDLVTLVCGDASVAPDHYYDAYFTKIGKIIKVDPPCPHKLVYLVDFNEVIHDDTNVWVTEHQVEPLFTV